MTSKNVQISYQRESILLVPDNSSVFFLVFIIVDQECVWYIYEKVRLISFCKKDLFRMFFVRAMKVDGICILSICVDFYCYFECKISLAIKCLWNVQFTHDFCATIVSSGHSYFTNFKLCTLALLTLKMFEHDDIKIIPSLFT